MPKLSFTQYDESDTPVAIVKGGTHDKKILYLHDDTIHKGKKKVAPVEAKPGEDKVIKLTDGEFQLIPSCDPKKRQVYYIPGQSGSGKSFIARMLATYYHKLYPERGVYLISKLEEDETLDACKFIKRINVNSLIEDPPHIDEFKDCFLIADDYDCFTGDAEKAVQKLLEDLCITGRHTNTTLALCSHYLTNFKKTRLILNEITHFVVYPMSTSPKPLKYLLETYVGCDPEDFDRHKRYGSRWLCYKRGFPMYCIGQTTAELLFC